MAWIEVHQGLATHHKLRAFKRLLKLPTAQAIGLIVLLWFWALDHAQDGDVTKFSPQTLADVCEWEGDPDALLDALVAAGFIDMEGDRHVIHDWMDYAGKLMDTRRKDAERKRTSGGLRTDSAGVHP